MKLESYPIFQSHQTSLSELSKDDHDGQNIVYMTDCKYTAVSFDDVKREYCNVNGLSDHRSSSVDALLENHGDIVFIEFKNGDFTSNEIKEKGNESMMIFCDVTGTNISDTRKNVDFILVYNETVKPLRPEQEKARRMARLSGEPYVRFDMEKHEGLCFRKIRTLDRNEFRTWLQQNHFYKDESSEQ